MKITQEQFDGLKQLDRIEYRQKEDRIKKLFNFSIGNIILNYLIIISVIALILLPQSILLYGREIAIEKLSFLFLGMGFFLFFTFMGFIVDIILHFKEKQLLNDLHNEYFKVEVNKK